ncbi:MAG: hypothetical protein K1X89_03565 [Myxococcaceae bacterium]|nr:hypothetical protein [Myxococcaceae bacterium]
MWLVLLALAATPDAGKPPPSAQQLLVASLEERFRHCEGLRLKETLPVELTLPKVCRFKHGELAQGTLRFELSPLAASDAPVRERAQRLRITAATFTLGDLEFDGVLLEGRLSEDLKDLTFLARTTPLKTRRRATGPGPGWFSTAPERDRPFNPLGDGARDVARGLAASPAIASVIAMSLAQTIQDGALASAPELLALWVLSTSGERRDGG